MTQLRQRLIEDLQLKGMSERTQQMYVRAVRQLAEHYHKPPDQISDEELRQSLRQECQTLVAERHHHRPVRPEVLLRVGGVSFSRLVSRRFGSADFWN